MLSTLALHELIFSSHACPSASARALEATRVLSSVAIFDSITGELLKIGLLSSRLYSGLIHCCHLIILFTTLPIPLFSPQVLKVVILLFASALSSR
jgi:hypothetical protein